MAEKCKQVMLPFANLPTTDGVLTAIANVIRDVQREHDLTDLQLACKIEVHTNTIQRARNKLCTLDSETLNRLGAFGGEGAMRPIKALWSRETGEHSEPMALLADAMGALARAQGPKAELDALPTIKDCIEGLNAWALEIEHKRMRLVS